MPNQKIEARSEGSVEATEGRTRKRAGGLWVVAEKTPGRRRQ